MTKGVIITLVGVAIVVIALIADLIGVGDNPATLEIGWKQLLGAGVGLLVIVIGVLNMINYKKMNKE